MSARTVLQAIVLRDDDELIEVKATDNDRRYFPDHKERYVYPIP